MISIQIMLVLALVGVALFLFFKEIFPIDVTALLIMISLMIFKLVTPEEGISGFSNHAVITILAMFILSAAIEKTGIIHSMSLRIFGITKSNEYLQLMMIMLLVALFSGFLNNAAIVAVLLPFVINLTKMSGTYASKLLIPLSYVSMSAGMLTLIGTSTNLLANDILHRLGLGGFSMFSFWKIGFFVLAITIVYFLIVGYFLLPKKKNANADSVYDELKYMFELKVLQNSSMIGEYIKDTILRQKYKVRIVRMKSGRRVYRERFSNRKLLDGDVITIEATRDVLVNLEGEPGVEIMIEELRKKDQAEETLQMIIPQNSMFIGKKVKELPFVMKSKAAVIAVRKGVQKIRKKMDNIVLELGDLLLIRTNKDYAEQIKKDSNLMIIEHLESAYKRDKRVIALLIMLAVIVVAALGIYPIIVTSLAGVMLMFMFGVISPDEAYQSIRLEVIFLLAGMIPLGIALEKSGAAAFIASAIVTIAKDIPTIALLIGFYVFTTLLTEVLSNNASVILLVPVAIDLAVQLGIDPIVMVLIIMFAASTSFLTPIGYKTNTMVYGTGVYEFKDFFKVGIFLNIILAIATPLLILWLW